MVTAKLNSYTPDEVRELFSLIVTARDNLQGSKHCKDGECSDCKMKHLCYDLESLADYLRREIEYDFPHCNH